MSTVLSSAVVANIRNCLTKAFPDVSGRNVLYLHFYEEDEIKDNGVPDVWNYLCDTADYIDMCSSFTQRNILHNGIPERSSRQRGTEFKPCHAERIETMLDVVNNSDDSDFLFVKVPKGDGHPMEIRLYAIRGVDSAVVYGAVFKPDSVLPVMKQTDSVATLQLFDAETNEPVGGTVPMADSKESLARFREQLNRMGSYLNLENAHLENYPVLEQDVATAEQYMQELNYDIHICKDCKKHYALSNLDKERFKQLKLCLPKRCPNCRKARRERGNA